MESADIVPEPEALGDLAMEARKSEDRATLKADYERWRREPFTELFLSYFQASADAHKDMCVQPGITDRDAHAHYHQAFEQVAGMADKVYMRADREIERRYQHEIQERDRELYGKDSESGASDLRFDGHDGFRGEGF